MWIAPCCAGTASRAVQRRSWRCGEGVWQGDRDLLKPELGGEGVGENRAARTQLCRVGGASPKHLCSCSYYSNMCRGFGWAAVCGLLDGDCIVESLLSRTRTTQLCEVVAGSPLLPHATPTPKPPLGFSTNSVGKSKCESMRFSTNSVETPKQGLRGFPTILSGNRNAKA